MIKLEIVLKDADYGEIIYKILPTVLTGMKDKEDSGKWIQILAGMSNIPGTLAKAALSVLPQEVKDDLVVKMLDGYCEEIREKVNQTLTKKQLPCEVKEIWASKV